MIIKQEEYNDQSQYPGGTPPDHFASEYKKQKPGYIKNFVDYYASIARIYRQGNAERASKNYNLLKGILKPEDYYQDPETSSFISTLSKNVELPKNIVHYSIMGTPINTLVGEQSRRPDQAKIKAMDEDSQNEELEYRNSILFKTFQQMVQESVETNAAIRGQELSEEERDAKIAEKLQTQLTSYSSKAERWANKVLNSCKVEFNMKELSEEAFRDLCIVAEEYYHVFEDSSKTGFSVSVENSKDIWQLTLPDRKYTSDLAGTNRGAFAIGTIKAMELSEIMDRLNLSKVEIDHLRKQIRESFSHEGRSTYGSSKTGINTVQYDTYSPLIEQERMIAESDILSGDAQLQDMLKLSPVLHTFGNKFIVTEGYVISKKTVGQLTYRDEAGNEQVTLVDESYQTIPNEIDIEWGYVNQWYKFHQVGTEIYNLEPFNLLPYCPIIGVRHEIKNTKSISLVDLMKPFQILYNVCMNQLFALLGKEIGVVYNISLRKIPRSKEGDGGDDIDLWEQEARDRGVIFESDSIEDMKIAGNTSPARAIDLSRSQEMQTRYNLAVTLKNECWELVGISRQRTGSVQATETATATNTAMTQSYAQTEPIFVQHEYVLNQVYQAIVDAAQYIEIQKPNSTISTLNAEGEPEFIRMLPEELRMRDLKVFVTSRAEDQRIFQKLEQLAGSMLQNGASAYEVALMFSTSSVRFMLDTLRKSHEKQQAQIEAQNALQQKQIEAQQEAVQAQIAAAAESHAQDLAHDSDEAELDRLARLQEVTIVAQSKTQVVDSDNDGTPDIIEMGKVQVQREKLYADIASKNQDRVMLAQQKLADLALREKIATQQDATKREEIKVKAQIAKSKPKSSK